MADTSSWLAASNRLAIGKLGDDAHREEGGRLVDLLGAHSTAPGAENLRVAMAQFTATPQAQTSTFVTLQKQVEERQVRQVEHIATITDLRKRMEVKDIEAKNLMSQYNQLQIQYANLKSQHDLIRSEGDEALQSRLDIPGASGLALSKSETDRDAAREEKESEAARDEYQRKFELINQRLQASERDFNSQLCRKDDELLQTKSRVDCLEQQLEKASENKQRQAGDLTTAIEKGRRLEKEVDSLRVGDAERRQKLQLFTSGLDGGQHCMSSSAGLVPEVACRILTRRLSP